MYASRFSNWHNIPQKDYPGNPSNDRTAKKWIGYGHLFRWLLHQPCLQLNLWSKPPKIGTLVTTSINVYFCIMYLFILCVMYLFRLFITLLITTIIKGVLKCMFNFTTKFFCAMHKMVFRVKLLPRIPVYKQQPCVAAQKFCNCKLYAQKFIPHDERTT